MGSLAGVIRSKLILSVGILGVSLLPSCGTSAGPATCNGTPVTGSAPIHGEAPQARVYEAMAAEPSGDLVLYGGQGMDRSDLFDTWLWDGRSWSQASPSRSPHLYSPLMTVDTARGQLLLIGSTIADPTQGSAPTETWLWEKGSWTQLHPSRAPRSYSLDSSLAYDTSTNQVVLYADIPRGYDATHEMWAWDGQSWSQISLPSGPFYAAPAWLAPAPDGGLLGLGEISVFGQSAGASYKWTGHDWKLMDVNGTPAALRAVAFDPVDHHLVVIGGLSRGLPDVAPPSDTAFVLDSGGWTATSLPSGLQGRVNPALAWYGSGCTFVLWGGVQGHGNINLPHPVTYTDTWYGNGDHWETVAN